jgi:hypothetical protein
MLKTEGYENSELFMSLTPKNGVKASKLYSYKPTNGNGDFVWQRNSTAYRLNQSGVLELMGSNMPRIDYTNTCPELLIEKSSTNLLLKSQEFNNASWTKGDITITANSTTAPDGSTTADTLTGSVGTAFKYIYQSISVFNNEHVCSFYVKKGTQRYIQILFSGIGEYANYDLQDLVTNKYGGAIDSNIIEYTDNWLRIDIYINQPSNSDGPFLCFVDSLVAGRASSTASTGTIYLWGAQLEKSEYATSYIPTTTTSVTRPKDVCYNKFNGYNDADWSVVMRVRLNNIGSSADEPLLALSDGTTDYYFAIYTDSNPKLHFTWYNNPDQDTYSTTDLSNGIVNVGVSFDSATADYIIVIDGTLFDSGILANIGAGLFGNFIRLDLGSVAGTGSPDKDGIIATQYFNTALTQSDLENLTA